MSRPESGHDLAGLPPGSRVSTQRLTNGLWIMAAQVPSARQLRLVGAVGVGYLHDPPNYRGLAHLLEHGLFLGSGRWPGKNALARWAGALGGRYNAYTGEQTTDIHLHLPVDAADDGLARLVDLLGNSRLEPGALADEVEVLDAEFRARLNDPALHRLAALGRLFDPSHPATVCHAGNRATLSDDRWDLASRLRAFYARYYSAERMALVMLGPQPACEQLDLLKRHGRRLPVTTVDTVDTPPPNRWRWNKARNVSWHPPNEPSLSSTSTIELLWPLPEAIAIAFALPLHATVAQLNNGTLTSTLQQAFMVQELEATTTPEGSGPALGLKIDLADSPADITPLVATCQQALRQTCRSDVIPPVPNTVVDLDAWPREQARRLSRHTDVWDCSPKSQCLHTLSTWLSPKQCRLLWRVGAERSTGAWRQTDETATPWRPLDLSCSLPAAILPKAPPPFSPCRDFDDQLITPRALDQPAAGLLYRDARLSLWWDGLDWPAHGTKASLCVGWAADAPGHDARLHDWRSRTLALRQAAGTQGLQLNLGSDARGDWLIASGTPTGLASLANRALDAWVASNAMAEPEGPAALSGMIAQQMLELLTKRRPPRSPDATPSLLCWARGDMVTREVQSSAHGFAERLSHVKGIPADPDSLRGSVQEMTWLTPQGDDRALMLELEGGGDSPRMRWLFQLLAHCHDATFYREMRQRRGFGYVAAVRYRESSGWPRLGYVVQSPEATIETLQQAILSFLDTYAVKLARLDEPQLERLRRGLLARQGPPETHGEAIDRAWQALRRSPLDTPPPRIWQLTPWHEEHSALDSLTTADLETLALALASGTLRMHWWAHAPA